MYEMPTVVSVEDPWVTTYNGVVEKLRSLGFRTSDVKTPDDMGRVIRINKNKINGPDFLVLSKAINSLKN